MILSTQDHNTLQRILGRVEIPLEVEQEYAIRASMYHMEATGPLGIAMLVDLVRALGYMPPKLKPQGEEVDWRQYPQDGRTKIESQFFGGWVPGVFRGFSENGLLICKMDHDDYVKEIRKDMVRVVTVLNAEQVAKEQEQIDVRGHLIALEEESIELGHKAAEAARLLERTKQKAARNAERNNGNVDPVLAEQIAELTQQADEVAQAAEKAKVKVRATPKPIKLTAPAPRGPNANESEDQVVADLDAELNGDVVIDEVEYKQYVPKGPTTLEDLSSVERDTPLFINPANPEEDALEAVFMRITEDNLVQVLVDGEENPRVVTPEQITLVT